MRDFHEHDHEERENGDSHGGITRTRLVLANPIWRELESIEVLLGAIRMEDMALIVRPLIPEVLVNPASQNIPSSLAKGLRQCGACE